MGRLTLNILLSFAQFEREVIGERIRDKFAASRRKGMWMGGNVPLGYRVEARKLVVVETEAELVRRIFARFAALGSALKVACELDTAGEVTKRWNANRKLQGGRPWAKGDVYQVLANRVYLGQAVHKGVAYPGEHTAIVDRELWDRAHAVMSEPTRQRAATSRAQVPMLLKGLIFGPNGRPMSPSHTKRRGRVHRYYVTREAIAEGYDSCPIKSVPAADIEAAVLAQVQRLLTTPEMIGRTWKTVNGEEGGIGEREVLGLLIDFGSLWAELFPAEQARIVRLLVERVDVQLDGLEVRLRADGLASLVAELRQQPVTSKAA
jgi:site-specific DNA recombinase